MLLPPQPIVESQSEKNRLDLYNWRHQTADMYRHVRQTTIDDPTAIGAWREFVVQREKMFAHHNQSPLAAEDRPWFKGLDYYPYDSRWRLTGLLDSDVEPVEFELVVGEDGIATLTRAARVVFLVDGQPAHLFLYWIKGYGGGLFLPFRDASNGQETFGGGRYLYDTIKGADLGISEQHIALDFNFAYNPSCAYNPHWVCPLPPIENRLAFPVMAGEKELPRIFRHN